MKIKNIHIYKYSLPFSTPLSFKGHKLSERQGIILHIISVQGVDGFGEIAPLPYFSRETMDDTIKQIKKVESCLTDEELPEDLHKLDGAFDGWLGALQLLPSLQFGIEMAVLNLFANAQNITLGHLITNETHEHIRINGLLQGNLTEVTHQAKKLKTEGFRAMKLKVGTHLNEDIAKVKAINKILDGKAILHLDANQSWNVQTAIDFGNQIGCASVDYIEEPFEQSDKIPHFFDATLIPVALDETILTMDFKDIQTIEGIDLIVLKPTLIGGIEKTWKFIKSANKQAIEIIISSAFESSIGILTLANLAGASTTRDHNAGIDTLKWFQNDLLKETIIFEKGKLDISQRKVTISDINFELLEKIK